MAGLMFNLSKQTAMNDLFQNFLSRAFAQQNLSRSFRDSGCCSVFFRGDMLNPPSSVHLAGLGFMMLLKWLHCWEQHLQPLAQPFRVLLLSKENVNKDRVFLGFTEFATEHQKKVAKMSVFDANYGQHFSTIPKHAALRAILSFHPCVDLSLASLCYACHDFP